MLGIRRKSSSSLSPCSWVCSRNSSGVAITTYLKQRASPAWPGGRRLVDEPQQIEARRRLDRPVVDPAPAGVIHLRYGEGPVGVHRLDVGNVPQDRKSVV